MRLTDSIAWRSLSLGDDHLAEFSQSVIDAVGNKLELARLILPRDAFNYSKVFKNLGQLSLQLFEGGFVKRMSIDLNQSRVAILLDGANSALWCPDILFIVRAANMSDRGHILYLISEYNDKSPYTLSLLTQSLECIDVFEDSGALTVEFKNYVMELESRI